MDRKHKDENPFALAMSFHLSFYGLEKVDHLCLRLFLQTNSRAAASKNVCKTVTNHLVKIRNRSTRETRSFGFAI